MLKKRKFTILFIGWLVLITSLSLFSFSSEGEDMIWFPNLDKIVHVVFHLFLVVLGVLFLKENFHKHLSMGKRVGLLIGFSTSYGVLIELLQSIMPFGRTAEVWDVLANLAGAVMGGLLIQRYRSLIDT
ncbi:VanZ family protein [Allomuricauda sp. SCSIO 64092]|uniref:VanZ family protein n=1 Tax=Allomuricauda sp. SCSIO 64092 TaxID=2908842 RepID=UPI00391C9B13